MTDRHPATPTDIDIRARADLVLAQMRQGRYGEAIRILEAARANERLAVQEALDRYVASGAGGEMARLEATEPLTAGDLAVLQRLQSATAAPRLPAHGRVAGQPDEFVGLTRAQAFDIYASMAEVRGDQAAKDALRLDGHSVLLGLRRENPTWASGDGRGRAGTGVYDDRIVVLTRGTQGQRDFFVADRASTEPTAQYSHHAGSNGRRQLPGAVGGLETRVLPPTPGYEAVTRPRRIEGEDVDGDTMRDLGRLTEGTVEMMIAEHRNPRAAGTSAAFRPSDEFIESGRGAGMVQRDTNADGYFTAADPQGVQNLNPTFKIHSGSRHNTDSAGCQTVHPEDYRALINAARANPHQSRWQYVLTSTQGGLFHNVEIGQEPRQPAAEPAERTPAAPERPADRQGSVARQFGPFEDPGLNHYYAAVLAGDAALANRIAFGFSFRAPAEREAQATLETPAEPLEAQVAQSVRAQEAPSLHI